MEPVKTDGTFASLLKNLRKRAGLQGQSLARAVGVSAAAVSHWERGARKPENPGVIRELLEALNASAEERAELLFLLGRPPGLTPEPDSAEKLIRALGEGLTKAAFHSSAVNRELGHSSVTSGRT